MNFSAAKPALLFFSIVVFGCKPSFKATTQTPVEEAGNKPVLSYSDQRKLDVSFSEGLIQKMQGNYPEAIDKFRKCLDVYPNHAASMYEISFIYNGGGKSADALPYAQKAVSLDETNSWYRLLLAKCYMETQKFNEASAAYEKLVKYNPEKLDNYYLWASALLHAGKVKEALEVYDKIEQMIGVTEEICLQKERIYLSLNQFDKAVAEAQKLIKSNPGEVNYHNMLAELYFQNKKPDKAIEICNNVFAISPNEPHTHLMLAEYYESISDDKSAFTHVKSAFENPELDIDEKVKILIAYFNIPEKFKAEREESQALIDILIQVHPHDAKSYSLQGDFLNRDGKKEEARSAFRKAIQLDKTRYPIWQQVMALDETLGDFDSLESESKQAIGIFPSEPYSYIFNASANYQKKNYKQAIDVSNEGKDYVAGDKKLLAQFYSIMGDCYNASKEFSLSDEKFEKTLNLDPENANVMNNWAYYLSLRNDKLDKAEKMGLKANELVKDNASYEDTYAWVLYKKGKYDEAKRWQERALEHAGDKNGTLLEHYGDILFQLGQADRGFEYWQKAKSAGKYSEFLDKKLLDKKMYE
jgi:tetratricopeptide (TPR) repeat protein